MNKFWSSCNLRPFSVPSAFFDVRQTDAGESCGDRGSKATYISARGPNFGIADMYLVWPL